MIYVTAHRVVTPDGHRSGINAFRHRHGGPSQPVPLTTESMLRIAENDPGELVADQCDLPPGGNHVRSYLDIVAADDIAPQAIDAALAAVRGRVVAGEVLPTLAVVERIGIRFGADFGLYDELATEYDALVERARALLNRSGA